MPSDVLPLIQKNVDLSPHNTLQVKATAKRYARIQSAESLQCLFEETDVPAQQLFVLGGGSNVLLVDDFEGLVLHIAITGKKKIKEDDKYVWLQVGAGENWHQTVRYCVEHGWGGIENLSLIPGTAGAAPIQNIGAYGVEFEQVFEELNALEIKTGKRQTFNKEACQFGYRDSIFKGALKGKYAVTDITMKLSKSPQLTIHYGAIEQKLAEKSVSDPTIADISDIVIEIRNSKLPDPKELPNAGSFFKNPVISDKLYQQLKQKFPALPGYKADGTHTKVPAGWLIEQAGWKGKEVGHVGTYRQQALVIVNHGGATGEEILQLAKHIQQAVSQKFSIKLIPEVNIIPE